MLYCQAQPQLQLSWAEMVFNVNLTPPTQPGKYQASKIKQFMLNGSCQSLGVKLKTFFEPNLNNLNMDPILLDRSQAYVTSPNFRLNYFF